MCTSSFLSDEDEAVDGEGGRVRGSRRGSRGRAGGHAEPSNPELARILAAAGERVEPRRAPSTGVWRTLFVWALVPLPAVLAVAVLVLVGRGLG